MHGRVALKIGSERGHESLQTLSMDVHLIAYRTNDGQVLQRFCGGTQSDTADPPRLFVVFYREFVDRGQEAVRRVLRRGEKLGEALAWIDPATLAAQAWHEAGRLIAALAITLPLLCGMVCAALARALRPTRYRANLKGDQRCAYLVENQDASPHLIICEGTSNTGVEA